eukprot:TRINITY_DN3065_c0_g1_i1.p1 TRINITY_DN3065_c0_g1~~TRINITY_DN3065_c0_g1_i1.p1  ORF type:complete len:138 (+),score=12.27 TRINITY_DN3065_c0_g1_i1:40-414(+)
MAQWGRTMALCGSLCLFVGSLEFVVSYDNSNPYAVMGYGLALSILIWMFWWPVPKMSVVQIVVQNYIVNSIVLFMCCIYCFFNLPHHLGGVCLLLSSIMFMFAGVRGEKSMSLDECKNGGRRRR